jgi:uncharacterized protein YeaO (DUF488 family)
MAIQVVRLGAKREREEGLRIGTVRRPSRGVPKSEYASQNWYDILLPNLAPSVALVKIAQAAETDKEWVFFTRSIAMKWRSPTRAGSLLCLRRCPGRPISPSAVIVRTRCAVIGPC